MDRRPAAHRIRSLHEAPAHQARVIAEIMSEMGQDETELVRSAAENVGLGMPKIFVAETEEGDFLGMVTVDTDNSDVDFDAAGAPWLMGLFVVPSARGQGLGSRLIEQAGEFARMSGSPVIFLDHTHDGPHDLYVRHGYETVGEAMWEGREMLVVMRKDLRQ